MGKKENTMEYTKMTFKENWAIYLLIALILFLVFFLLRL